MRRLILGLFFALFAAASGVAQDSVISAAQADPCEVPGYMLLGDAKLEEVSKAVKERRQLNILVLGTGSSALSGGGAKAYPAHLQEALRRRFPEITVRQRWRNWGGVVTGPSLRRRAADPAGGLPRFHDRTRRGDVSPIRATRPWPEL